MHARCMWILPNGRGELQNAIEIVDCERNFKMGDDFFFFFFPSSDNILN